MSYVFCIYAYCVVIGIVGIGSEYVRVMYNCKHFTEQLAKCFIIIYSFWIDIIWVRRLVYFARTMSSFGGTKLHPTVVCHRKIQLIIPINIAKLSFIINKDDIFNKLWIKQPNNYNSWTVY